MCTNFCDYNFVYDKKLSLDYPGRNLCQSHINKLTIL